MPISHELLPSGQSVASIVYVPASTWTKHVRLFHESTFCVVEPLNRYVPGDGSVTITPGSVPNVLGSPVTRGYRFTGILHIYNVPSESIFKSPSSSLLELLKKISVLLVPAPLLAFDVSSLSPCHFLLLSYDLEQFFDIFVSMTHLHAY